MIIDISPESLDYLGRLSLAAFLGGLVGLQRDIHGRAAGLRTYLLVSLGAALFMIISINIAGPSGDPGRIAAQVVTGIGFLGAGAIMKEGFSVRGLTSAACFWVVAAIGMAAAAAMYTLALFTSLLALFALALLNHLEKCYRRDSYRTLTITTSLDSSIDKLLDAINHDHVTILLVDSDRDYQTRSLSISIYLRIFQRGRTDRISQDIIDALEQTQIPITNVSWHHGTPGSR